MDEMRRDALPDATLLERLPNQPKLEIAQVAQSAMHQFGIVCARGAGKITAFDQRHFESAHAGVARHTGARHTTSDDEQVEHFVGETVDGALHGIRRKRTRVSSGPTAILSSKPQPLSFPEQRGMST